MKTILFVGPIPPEVGGDSAGGIATHNWELAQECAKNGYKVYIYSGQIENDKEINKVNLVGKLSKFSKIINFEMIFNLKKLNHKVILKSIIKRTKPDIIHFHSLHSNFLDVVDDNIKKNKRILVTDHSFWNSPKNLDKIQRNINRVDNIISITEQFNEKLKKYNLTCDAKKITKIYHPINSSLYNDIKQGRIANKIFYSCYSDPLRKGLLEIISLFKNYDLNKYHFIITLNSEGIDIFNKHFQKIPANIEIHNGLTFNECLKEYATSKLFLMPSYSEGFAMVFREALLVGTPILGYKPNVDEIKENYSTYIGESFDLITETEKDLFEKINKVMNTDFNHVKIIEETKLNFSWENQFIKYDDIYRG